MGPFRLMCKEMLRRPAALVLGIAAVTIAVCLPVMTWTISDGLGAKVERNAEYIRDMTKRISDEMKDQTRRIMLDMGVNLVFLSKDNTFHRYKDRRFPQPLMPEEYVARLANTAGLVADHYIGRLQTAVQASVVGSDAAPQDVIVNGVLPEMGAVDRAKKAPLPEAFDIRQDSCFIGQDVADALGVRKGQQITLRRGNDEVTVRVLRVFDPRNLRELQIDGDTIYIHLHTAQKLFGGQHVITAVEALSCRCETGQHPADFIEENRRRIEKEIPDVRMYVMQGIWQAREDMREQAEKKGAQQEQLATKGGQEFQRDVQLFGGVFSGVLIAACSVLMGLLMVANVRERSSEVGVLLAVGWRPAKVGRLFGSKAVTIGLIGGLLGIGLGIVLSTGTAGMFARMVPAGELQRPPTGTLGEMLPMSASRPASAPASEPARPKKMAGPPVPKPPPANELPLSGQPWLWLIALLGAPLLTLACSSVAIVKATHTDPAVTLVQR